MLLLALAAIAAIAYSLEVWTELDADDGRGGTSFDATVVIALVALYVGGPLPALAVWLVPDLLDRCVFRRTPLLTSGLALNVASFAAAVLAGAAILGVDDGGLGLLVAGAVMVHLNFLISPLLYAVLFERPEHRRLLYGEYVALAPVTVAMLAVAVATALLTSAADLAALVLLTAAVVLPEMRWRALAERWHAHAAALAPHEAARVYAEAIADVMRLPRRERRLLACAPDHARPAPPAGLRGLGHELAAMIAELGPALAGGAAAEAVEAGLVARRAEERFDGADWPVGAGLLAPAPLASRVIAVSRAWAELTAAGTAELPHDRALARLEARAGGELDPAIVAAAARVVAQEAVFAQDPGFEPRLHRLPLPYGVRRGVVPTVLRRLTT